MKHTWSCRVNDNGRCSCGADESCYCDGCGARIRCPGATAPHRCAECALAQKDGG